METLAAAQYPGAADRPSELMHPSHPAPSSTSGGRLVSTRRLVFAIAHLSNLAIRVASVSTNGFVERHHVFSEVSVENVILLAKSGANSSSSLSVSPAINRRVSFCATGDVSIHFQELAHHVGLSAPCMSLITASRRGGCGASSFPPTPNSRIRLREGVRRVSKLAAERL